MFTTPEKITAMKETEEDLLNIFDRRREKENHFYIKVSICHWNDANGLHMRKDIRVLSRKSGKHWSVWFNEDCSNAGADVMYKSFRDLEEGVYKVTMALQYDWESGYVDDWNYITEKI